MKMPTIGKIVLWFNGGDRKHGGNPAIVTATTHNAIRCNVFQPGSSACRATNWVRHIDDPWNDEHRIARDEHGTWDWMDCDKIEAAMFDMSSGPVVGTSIVADAANELDEILAQDQLPETGRAARKKAKATS